MKDKLKLCPFCGKSAEYYVHHKNTDGSDNIRVQCSSKAIGCPLYQSFDDADDWNRQKGFDRSDYRKLGGVSDLHIEKQEAIGAVLDDMQKHGISIEELIEARKIID